MKMLKSSRQAVLGVLDPTFPDAIDRGLARRDQTRDLGLTQAGGDEFFDEIGQHGARMLYASVSKSNTRVHWERADNALVHKSQHVGEIIKRLMKERGIRSGGELARLSGVKQGTVSRVLSGESKEPRRGTLDKLAKPLGVDLLSILNLAQSPSTGTYTVERGPQIRGQVPLISWEQAGRWCNADEPDPEGTEAWLPCPVVHGLRSFALRVRGDSMDNGAPDGYRDGELIFVDPDREAKHNDDVIVRTPNGNATFKRLQKTSDGNFLLALNEHYPERIARLPQDAMICGVVIFSGRERRR